MHVQPQRARRGAEVTILRMAVFDITQYTHAFIYIYVYKQHRWCSIKLGWACSVIATRGRLQQTHGSHFLSPWLHCCFEIPVSRFFECSCVLPALALLPSKMTMLT